MNGRSKTLVLSGVIILALTSAICVLCIKDWSGITAPAFAMILWAELVFFGGLVVVEKIAAHTEQPFLRASFGVLLTIYGLLSIAVSVIYILACKNAKTSFIIIQLILLAALSIGLLVFYTTSKSIHEANDKTKEGLS